MIRRALVREATPSRSRIQFRTWGGGLSRPDAAETMDQMRANVRRSLYTRRVVETARNIIKFLPARDEVTQARAIRRWCLERFQFVKDPVDVEYLETPTYQLGRIRDNGVIQGDCDDAAQLTAALAMAIGIPCRFFAVARRANAPYTHVYTIAYPLDRGTGRRVAIEMDITRPLEIHTMPAFLRRLPLQV